MNRPSRFVRVCPAAVCILPLIPPALVVPSGGMAAAATVQPAGPHSDAVQLVQQYLLDLGVARNKLSKTEVALKALGPSATRAQVLATVTPLGPVLAPIEALLAAPPPTTLEALGEQIHSGFEATTYRTTDEGAHLDVGGRLYPNGFQVNMGLGVLLLSWPTHNRYTSLSAQVGMDGLNSNTGAVASISFDDPTSTRIPFFDKGKLVFQANVPTTGLLSVNVPVAHESELQIRFRLTAPHEGDTGVVDVVNDHLS
jgi:hypothetical protein